MKRSKRFLRRALLALCLANSIALCGGCAPLRPRSITTDQFYLSEQLRDGTPQIQRGKPRKILDATGWVLGIPDKIVLWNRRVDSHHISPHTEEVINEYLAVNSLDTTRVRLNQYYPSDDWRRLVKNKTVAAPWRYTFGAVFTAYETIIPGRLFGGDHYNPYTDTIHLYSDVPAIALHEAAHAKDFARRQYKGTYAAAYILPGAPLYHESIATGDALAYSQLYSSARDHKEAYHVLYPAYGTYIGSVLGTPFPRYSSPIFYGSVVAGHLWGRQVARGLPDETNVRQLGEYYPKEEMVLESSQP